MAYYYRRSYGRRYRRNYGGFRTRTRKIYVRSRAGISTFIKNKKLKNTVKWLSLALVLVGAVAILKPATLKSWMSKVGLKTA